VYDLEVDQGKTGLRLWRKDCWTQQLNKEDALVDNNKWTTLIKDKGQK